MQKKYIFHVFELLILLINSIYLFLYLIIFHLLYKSNIVKKKFDPRYSLKNKNVPCTPCLLQMRDWPNVFRPLVPRVCVLATWHRWWLRAQNTDKNAKECRGAQLPAAAAQQRPAAGFHFILYAPHSPGYLCAPESPTPDCRQSTCSTVMSSRCT